MTRLKRSGFNLKIAVIIPLHLNLTARWHVLHQFPGRSCPGLCNLCDGLLRNRAQIGPQFTPICSFNDRSESNNILLRMYLVDFSSNRLMCKTLFISCFYCQILILSTKNNFIHAYTTKFITFKRYFRYLTLYLHVFNGHIYHEKLFLRWSNRKYYTLKLAIARKGACSVSFWWDQLLRECPSSGIYCDEGIELSLPSHP